MQYERPCREENSLLKRKASFRSWDNRKNMDKVIIKLLRLFFIHIIVKQAFFVFPSEEKSRFFPSISESNQGN